MAASNSPIPNFFSFRYLNFLERPPSGSSGWPIQCAGANSRKKAVRLLTNLRLLSPPRHTAPQAGDGEWAVYAGVGGRGLCSQKTYFLGTHWTWKTWVLWYLQVHH